MKTSQFRSVQWGIAFIAVLASGESVFASCESVVAKKSWDAAFQAKCEKKETSASSCKSCVAGSIAGSYSRYNDRDPRCVEHFLRWSEDAQKRCDQIFFRPGGSGASGGSREGGSSAGAKKAFVQFADVNPIPGEISGDLVLTNVADDGTVRGYAVSLHDGSLRLDHLRFSPKSASGTYRFSITKVKVPSRDPRLGIYTVATNGKEVLLELVRVVDLATATPPEHGKLLNEKGQQGMAGGEKSASPTPQVNGGKPALPAQTKVSE